MKRRLSAVLLLIPITAAGGVSLTSGRVAASAGIAPPYYQGSQGSGIVSQTQTAVNVASEILTFRIDSLPKGEFGTAEDFFGATMTAEYRLQNVSSEDVKLRLFFPVGTTTDYLSSLPDGSLCTITAGGEGVETIMRYTYCADEENAKFYGTYDVMDAIPKNDYDESVYAHDMNVYIYRYAVSIPETETSTGYFHFSYDCNTRKTQVVNLSGMGSFIRNGRGYSECALPTGMKSEVTVVAFGEAPDDIRTEVCLSWYDGECVPGAQIEAEEIRTLTYEEWALSMYELACETAPMSETDWYNVVSEIMADGTYLSYLPVTDRGGESFVDCLRCWCEYEITVPANGTLVNTVSAPVFPTYMGGSRSLWAFDYDLSSDQCWAGFGEIAIHIETDYLLEESALSFTKREGGYTFTMDGLPMGDLSFTLAETEDGATVYDPYEGGVSTLHSVLILLGVVAGIAVITVVVVFVIRRRNRKAVEEQQRRLDGMHAQQGKVDIDPPVRGNDEDAK